MSIKSCYCGVFNYSHELVKVYAYAYNLKQAKLIMIRHLAAKHEVSPSVVWGKFPDFADNHEIRLETEWIEINEKEEQNGKGNA